MTTARTVAFMAEHEEIAERVWEWVDMMADSMEKCKTAGEEAQRMCASVMLECMRGMERSIGEQLGALRAEQRVDARETREAMGAQMKDGMTGIGRSVEALGGQGQQQLMALMGTVEGHRKNDTDQRHKMHSSTHIHEKQYRASMNSVGMAFATLARVKGCENALHDYGFHNHCPVCIRDEIAEILNLPLDSYWTPDEIGEIVSCLGHRFALFLWDTYISTGYSSHLYLPDGKLMTSKLPKYRDYIIDTSHTSGIQNAFTLIGSTWYIKKIKYDKL